MKTLMIQVLGVGLIPRGKGIAPKKEPFPATKKEIELIMEHGTLQPRMRNPKTGKYVDITSKNFDKLWDSFAIEREEKKIVINRQKATPKEITPVKKEEPKPEVKPAQPTQVQFTKQNQNNKPKWEQKQEQRHEQKQEPKPPVEEPKHEEEKKNDESFAVTTSSDKK